MLHVVVLCMQVHAVVLQSVEPVHGMRTARIYIAVLALTFDVVEDILPFWSRLLKYGVASAVLSSY